MMKYIISAGHTQTGTIGCGAVKFIDESKCTREVGLLVAEKLKNLGHQVTYLQIDKGNSYSCEDCHVRASEANRAGGDFFVEIHFNAGGGTGCEVLVNKNTSSNTKDIAARVSSSIAMEMGFRDRGVKNGNLIVLNKTAMPAMLIECLFVDSSDAYMYDANKLAIAIVRGLTGQTVSSSSDWKQGWNQDSTGWWYSPDPVNKTYYTSQDGWKEIDGEWYMFNNSGYALSHTWYHYWKDNRWYYFNNDCKMVHSQWVLWNDLWYYMNKDGAMVTSEYVHYNGKTYYMDEDGVMITGCSFDGHEFGPDGAMIR